MKGAELVEQAGYLSSVGVDQQESDVLSVLRVRGEEGVARGVPGDDLDDGRPHRELAGLVLFVNPEKLLFGYRDLCTGFSAPGFKLVPRGR